VKCENWGPKCDVQYNISGAIKGCEIQYFRGDKGLLEKERITQLLFLGSLKEALSLKEARAKQYVCFLSSNEFDPFGEIT